MAEFDPDRIYAALSEAGQDYADKKASHKALHEVTASVLAQLIQAHLGTSASHAEAKTMALASVTYRDHLASVALAHKAYLQAQVKYDSVKALSELRRSQESSNRAAMTMR